MLQLSGWILTHDGFRPGSVIIDEGIIQEVSSTRAKDPTAEGVIMPSLFNAHIHLGDSVIEEEPRGTVDELFAPPDGLKHRLLEQSSDEDVTNAMRVSLEKMFSTGTTGFCDFREGGIKGASLLYKSLLGMPHEPVVMGRPAHLHYDKRELRALLKIVDGIGLSAISDWEYPEIEKVAQETKQAGKKLALHASETRREDIDLILDLKPDFLIHMTMATRDDVERCADEGVGIVLCPRSNLFFGNIPDIRMMIDAGATLMLGTDNVMLNEPSMLREMEFAYKLSRLKGEVEAREILSIALNSRKALSEEGALNVEPGEPVDLMVLRVARERPKFHHVTRALESSVAMVCKGDYLWSAKEGRIKRLLES